VGRRRGLEAREGGRVTAAEPVFSDRSRELEIAVLPWVWAAEVEGRKKAEREQESQKR
jgi:hypothetical protein